MAGIYRILAFLPLDADRPAREPAPMQIAILIFDKLTALDAIGPYEVLRSVPGWEVKFVGPEKGQARTDSGALGLSADFGLDEVSEADIVLVPGGEGNRPLMEDEAVLSWLRRIDA